MSIKWAIHNVMNNKTAFLLVWITIIIIIGLLALTAGIAKFDSDLMPMPTVYTKGSVFWLPYHIADTGIAYYENKLGVEGFSFFSKYVSITPYYLFVLSILYWMFLAFVLTTVCYLQIIRRHTREPSYSKIDIYH